MSTTDSGRLSLRVTINGSSTNPWDRYGLDRIPLPQIARHELNPAMMQRASVDRDPITGPEDIRARLAGWSAEFIELCIAQYVPGQRIAFAVNFPAERREVQA